MRFSRVLAAFLLVAAVALTVAWRVGASQRASRPAAAAARSRSSHPRSMLERELRQFLTRRRARQPFLASLPVGRFGPGTCFVAGNCSEKPCILDIKDQRASVALTPLTAAVVARPRLSGPDEVPISGCQGLLRGPQVLRVSARLAPSRPSP